MIHDSCISQHNANHSYVFRQITTWILGKTDIEELFENLLWWTRKEAAATTINTPESVGHRELFFLKRMKQARWSNDI